MRPQNEPHRHIHADFLVGVVAVTPLSWKLIAAGVALASITAWHMSAVRTARNEGRAEIQSILDAERIAARHAAASQAESNRLAAESAQEQAGKREAALQTRLKGMRRELWTATENLATCRLSAASIGLLNDAASGAREDKPATSRAR